jgi:hypothetical protein
LAAWIHGRAEKRWQREYCTISGGNQADSSSGDHVTSY